MTWKSLCHPNVLPLLGVIMSETQFGMVSEWLPNGNINQFVKTHWDANRFDLVCSPFRFLASYLVVDGYTIPQLGDVAVGLIYMHEQGMVHGDLKGVRFPVLGSPSIPDGHCQGQRPDRRNQTRTPGRLWSAHSCIGHHKPHVTDVVHTRWHTPMDESRTL